MAISFKFNAFYALQRHLAEASVQISEAKSKNRLCGTWRKHITSKSSRGSYVLHRGSWPEAFKEVMTISSN